MPVRPDCARQTSRGDLRCASFPVNEDARKRLARLDSGRAEYKEKIERLSLQLRRAGLASGPDSVKFPFCGATSLAVTKERVAANRPAAILALAYNSRVLSERCQAKGNRLARMGNEVHGALEPFASFAGKKV